MKSKLVLLFVAVLTLGSLSSCVDPCYGGGYGYGYRSSNYRPYYSSYSYNRYGPVYRAPSYGYGGHHHGGYGGSHHGGHHH